MSVLLAVGIALGAITVANRLGYDGEQPGVQSEVIPEADVSQSLPPSTQPLQETNPNEPATAGSAPASSAQTAGALTTSTGATAPAIAPATGGQQPAVVSSLDDDDVGFGWPTSAFGTAGG